MEPITLNLFTPDIRLSVERRTIEGRITVFNTATKDYRRIIIHDGALQPRTPLSRVKMLRDHDQRDPVGYMLAINGDWASFKIAEGENGDRALHEASPEVKLRDGLSVGIQILPEEGASRYDSETQELHVYKAELVEVSLCAIPAYEDAQVEKVNASHQSTPPKTPPAHKENTTMNAVQLAAKLAAGEITQEQHDAALAALGTFAGPTSTTLTRAELDTALAAQRDESTRAMEARLAALDFTPGHGAPQFASMGEFVKAFAAGLQEAKDFQLAYTGAKSSDDYSRNAWLADAIRLVEKTRKTINKFTREPLPDKGLTLEYAQLATNTVAVGKQATQGATLATGKVTLTSAVANVDTYGGYTELSIQIIERANSAYISTVFKAMLIEYARATEAAVRAVYDTARDAQVTAGNKLDLVAAPTAFQWLDLLVDASEKFDDKGYQLEGADVSKDVFKQLMRLEDSAGNMLMRVQGEGVNQTGTIDVKGLNGGLAGVQFSILNGAPVGTLAFYDSIGLTSWEDSSPTQLEDSTASNLTKGYSVYGYLAAASQFPDAILPVVIAAA